MKTSFWKEKVVLITGASSGIGEALWKILLPFVSKIYLLQRREPNYTLVQNSKDKTIFLSTDLSNSTSLQKSLEKILHWEKSGPGIHALFNNAGITAHGRLDSTKLEVFRKTFEINFFAPIQITQSLTPLLKKAKGVVVTTSTVSGLYGVPGRAAYSSSKSAIQAAMESYRIEMSEFGVRSVIVCPPYTRTALRTSGLDAEGKQLSEPQAGENIKTPEEVAYKIIQAAENPKARLVTIDPSGFVMKTLRLFAPGLLEKIMYQKLYKDFH